jgi:hypothetical protein
VCDDDGVVDEDPVRVPILLCAAEADVCATRLLSDILWDLFIVGQPLLLFKTNRSEEELKTFSTNVTKYLTLQVGRGQQDGEDMEYLQLDSTGLDLQIAMHERMVARAQELGGQGGDAALATPTEQSGISRAWQFKTGEERLLFLLTSNLQDAFNRVLDMVAVYAGVDPDSVHICFNEEFDMTTADDEAKLTSKTINYYREFRLGASIKLALRKMTAKHFASASEADRLAVEQEIEKLDIEKLREEAMSEMGREPFGNTLKQQVAEENKGGRPKKGEEKDQE